MSSDHAVHAPHPVLPDPEQAVVERLRIETLMRFNTAGIALSFALGPLVAWRLGAASEAKQFWLWCVALYAVAGLRGFMGLCFQRRRQWFSDRHWHQIFICSAMLVGACWGVLMLPLMAMSEQLRLLATALLMAIAGIGLITYMASGRAFVAFSVPILSGLIYAAATGHTTMGTDASLTVGFFSLIMLFGSRRVSHQFESATRLRWHEAQRRLEADAANAAKSRFLAAMSHELRTPISGIIGMAQLLKSASLAPPYDRYVTSMQGACEHLLGVVDDILDFARVDAHQLKIDLVAIPLRSTIADALAPLESAARTKGLAFHIDVDAALPEWILCDRLRLAQILINLVGNAVKFTAQGEVRCVASMEKAGSWQLAVSDTGVGIAAEKLGAIFDPFVQAEVSYARRFGGSGLGLSICRELVQLMQGEISVTSELGRGTSFLVRLPLVAAEAATPMAPVESSELPPAELLIAEDDVLSREIILSYVEALGMTARVVSNGMEAIAAYQQRAPNLLLMDCEMPTMDGLEATRQLRALGATVPILALTAHVLAEHHDACRAAGMDDVMTKPISLATLRVMLKKFLPINSNSARNSLSAG